MHAPRRKQTGQALIGYLFIGYALFTLALTLYLSNPSQLHTEVGAQPGKSAVLDQQPAVTKPTLSNLQAAVDVDVDVEKSRLKTGTKNYPTRPDFGAIKDVKTKKETFFLYLMPAIERENQRMSLAQQQLKTMSELVQTQKPLNAEQQRSLKLWSGDYRIDTELPTTTQIGQLLERMDAIPASMVLAQGAMESAWGTSRFARQANNYFGQWCFSKGCGIVPSQRNSGASHEVATFRDAHAAVAAYFKNINRHPAYQRVRDERLALRQSGKPLDSLAMVRGLDKYSARGHAYIEELQSMIRYNKIKRFD